MSKYPKYKCLYILITFLVLFLNATTLFAGDATLSWDAPTTNADGTPLTDLAGYKVYYGALSGNYSQNIDVGNVTTYQVANLTDGLTYYFVVTAYDTSGNESGYSNEVSKTITVTPDTTPPLISNVQTTNITSSSATITWTTNEASTSQVEYGLTTSYGNLTPLNSSLVTAHSVNITGLSSYTTYNFRVRSQDASNNEAISNNYTFTTSNLSPTITSFTANPVSGAAPLIVNFTASASDPDGYIVRYEWDFNGDGVYDGNTQGVSTASFTYTNAGTYNTRVRVTDNGGASTVSGVRTITVTSPINQPPVVSSLTANPSAGTAPLTVIFSTNASDPDGSIVQYEWDFDGNGTYDAVTTTNPVSNTYINAGTYTVRVRVTDNLGATATGETIITITEGSTNTGGQNPNNSVSAGGGCGTIRDTSGSDKNGQITLNMLIPLLVALVIRILNLRKQVYLTHNLNTLSYYRRYVC